MKFYFLRGSVPPKNEHPEKLLYDSIENCEDMWTQLFFHIANELGASGEILYSKGKRRFKIKKGLFEKWVLDVSSYRPKFNPDIIFCRGGFPYYDGFVKKFPKAKKIYYGAGKRYYPQTKFDNYDLFLVDSKKQFSSIQKKGKNVKLFTKPAASLFIPQNSTKEYDICFIANGPQKAIKRHELLLRTFAGSEYKILNIGIKDKKLIKLAKKLDVNITWDGWSLRKYLPNKISKCKLGICCSTNYDSCPRVIPEYLACNLPIVVTKNINFWQEKYITKQTGISIKENEILKGVTYILDNLAYYKPRKYYEKHLSLQVSAKYISQLIRQL